MPFPLLAALGIGAVASGIGSIFGASSADKAAKTQAATAKENRAIAERYTGLSLDEFDTALTGALGEFDRAAASPTGLSPYATAGNQALSRLGDIYGFAGQEGHDRALSSFETSPGYQFRLSQGVQAMDRSANARSGLYGGAQAKALTEYGQGVGSQEWGNYVGGLSGIANAGQNAASGLTNIAGSRANAILGTAANRAGARSSGLSAITGANAQAGAATAGGYINQANAWNAGLNNLTQLAMFGASKQAVG